MSYYSDFYPDRGDLSALTGFSSALETHGTQLTDTATAVATAAATVENAEVWGGEAADAWRPRAAAAHPPLGEVAAELGRVQTAVATYIGTVDDIIQRTADPRGRVEDAEQELNRIYWSSSYRGSPAYGAPQFCGVEPDEVQVSRELATAGANAALERARDDLRSLEQERDAAGSLLIQALSEGESDSWSALRSALAAAGISSADQITPSALADAMQRLSTDILEGEGSDELYQRLQALFDEFGDDPDVMARYFNSMGGNVTGALVEQIGVDGSAGIVDGAAAFALAAALRRGLAVGSQNWTPATSLRFARELSTRPAAAGFLFSDAEGATMGEELTVAMADLVDDAERSDPNFPGWDYMANPGAVYLIGADAAGGPPRGLDLGARAMQMLGQYPDAALDWLTETDEGLGDARVEYWFGLRDSGAASPTGSGDGYEGVSALWAGALRADGGILAGGTNAEQMVRIAELSTTIFEQFASNPFVSTTEMSALGAQQLAGALALQFPQLVEAPITGYIPGQTDSYLTHTVLMGDPPSLIEIPIPNVDIDTLRTLMALASAEGVGAWALPSDEPTGASILGFAATDYQSDLLALAGSDQWTGAVRENFSPEMALDRFAAAQGIVDGSYASAKLQDAPDADQQARAAAEFMGNLVSGLPLPGPVAVGYIGGLVWGEIVDGAVEQGLDTWATEYRDALNGIEIGSPEREEAVYQALVELAQQMEENGHASPDDAPGDAMGRYRDGWDAIVPKDLIREDA